MTVKLISTIQRFIGLSTDAKPDNAPEGSTFAETDTGRDWVFNDGWIEDLATNLSAGRAIRLNSELRYLTEQTYLEVRAANQANGIEVS